MTDPKNVHYLRREAPILSAPMELKKACKNTRLNYAAQELFARWPNLRESSQRLTSLLTLHYPDPRKEGESLLVNCLASGLIDAEKAILKNNDDLAEQKAFISRVSEELVHCLALTLMMKVRGSWTPHDVITHGYLDGIVNSSMSEELNWIEKPQAAFKSPVAKVLCASRVFTMSELKLAGLI
jgi:hypothetical protein